MVQTAGPDLVAQLVLLGVAAAFLVGTGRRSGRSRSRSRWRYRRAAFLGGLVCVWVAVGSRLASYDDTSVTAHVVQHLLLMMVAPPLLVLGRPFTVLARGAPRAVQSRLARMWHSKGFRLATHPGPATLLYLGSMYAMFVSRPVYGYLISHDALHEASHAWLLIVGGLYFESLLGVGAGRLAPPFRVVAVLAVMPFEALVGIWLRYQTGALYLVGGRVGVPVSTLADTQRAGEAFIVGSTLVSTVWLAVIVGQWAARELRNERRASTAPPAMEWTTPWWASSAAEVNEAGGNP